MDGRTYAEEVLRTYTGSQDPKTQLTLSALGLTGESGEVADAVKKNLFQGHELDQLRLAEELGDILWYLVLGCRAIGFTLEDIMQLNVVKLRRRYPNGFDVERSRNRDLYEGDPLRSCVGGTDVVSHE